MHERLGEVLETLCRTGRNEAVIVAPFIKRATLNRLLVALPISVRLLCVTRWRPEEVAAGVSDPDIWLDIQQRDGATLRLCPSLHAKYYRVDEECLVGSANITDTALGWSVAPNFELLCPFGGSKTERQQFEEQLRVLSVPCQEAIYHQVKEAAALLATDIKSLNLLYNETSNQFLAETRSPYDVEDASAVTFPNLSSWLPQSRQPADLFVAYSEQWERLSTASRLTTLSDLAALQIPAGLTQPLFTQYVAMQLLQIPCVASVDAFVSESQRFGAVTAHLRSLPCSKLPDFDSNRAWQTLMRWLLHFLPQRYERIVPNHSEVFRVRK